MGYGRYIIFISQYFFRVFRCPILFPIRSIGRSFCQPLLSTIIRGKTDNHQAGIVCVFLCQLLQEGHLITTRATPRSPDIKENSQETAQLLFNIGQSYQQISDPENALKYFRKSLSHTAEADELRYKCYLAMVTIHKALLSGEIGDLLQRPITIWDGIQKEDMTGLSELMQKHGDWCSVNNAGFEYYQNAKKDGIGLPPHNPRIWVFRHQSNASCAPMLRRVWHPIGYSSNSGWSNFFINITAGRLLTYTNTLLKFALPDIVIGTGGGYNTYDIYESVNHELSHASHFNKVGSAFWAKYVNYIITYGKKYDHPYGDASCNNSGFCGVGEMWGYAMGYIRTYEKYQQKPKNGQSKWFQPNLLYDLMTEKILTKKQIFDCLSSDVTSHALLKQKMISRYPSKKDSIIAKFSRYGF